MFYSSVYPAIEYLISSRLSTIALSLYQAVVVAEEVQVALLCFPWLESTFGPVERLVTEQDALVRISFADFVELERDRLHPAAAGCVPEWRVPELAARAAVARLIVRLRGGRRASRKRSAGDFSFVIVNN